ncbi:MAG: RidA family protein [Candidatus Magnetominusculus sp. LBB02]|nr:RidA family protein [Candidatus Magnetominusculus sp. LBB02]
MADIEQRLKEKGLAMPNAPAPLGAYVPAVISGNLLFLSGMLPLREGKLISTGRVGLDVALEQVREAAAQVVLNALAVVKQAVGDFSRVRRCVKLTGYVASAEGFTDQPQALNGASELLFELMGECGQHCRSAVGVSVLPLNSPIEIDFIFEIDKAAACPDQ